MSLNTSNPQRGINGGGKQLHEEGKNGILGNNLQFANETGRLGFMFEAKQSNHGNQNTLNTQSKNGKNTKNQDFVKNNSFGNQNYQEQVENEKQLIEFVNLANSLQNQQEKQSQNKIQQGNPEVILQNAAKILALLGFKDETLKKMSEKDILSKDSAITIDPKILQKVSNNPEQAQNNTSALILKIKQAIEGKKISIDAIAKQMQAQNSANSRG